MGGFAEPWSRCCLGSFNFDRSIVTIGRTPPEVTCFVGKDVTRKRRTWPSLDDWPKFKDCPGFVMNSETALSKRRSSCPKAHAGQVERRD